MKLANLSICLVLVAMLSGCFNGTKQQNITPEPQSLADLQLKPLKLDIGGRLTAQSAKELRDFAVSKNTEPIFIVANNFNDKTIANISESIEKLQFQREIVMVDIANNTFTYLTKPVPDDIKRVERPKRKPMPLCAVYPDICASVKLEKCKKIRNCFVEKIECKQENCLAHILEKSKIAKAYETESKKTKLAEANEAMFAIYDANITNSKVEKASIQKKAKQ